MYRYLYAILVFSVLHLYANARVPNCERPTWLLCNNGRCIMSLFECDGENDCGDMSDEMNCTDFNFVLPDIQCANDEYQCKDNHTCIPIEKFCDVSHDCPDDSDEYDGCVKELKCNTFRCNDGHCIKDEWVCDGVADCPDKSDETKCGNITLNTSQCNNENDRYLCKNQRCILLSATCNKKDDCGDGSDEDTDGCAKAEDLCTKTTKCNHYCRRTPQGPMCACQKGYKISDNETCVDVDECENYGACGQRCINNAGSYTCACEAGYNLQDDKKSCKAEGGEALMVFSVKSEIRGFYLDSEVYYPIARDLQHAVSVSLDANYVYWSDIEDGEEAIIRSLEDGTQREVIVTTGLNSPDEIAVDWITGNIYFSDSGYMHIGVCTNDGSYCTVIFKEQYNKPRGLALLPVNGIMYWSKWGSKPGIITAGMDGKESREFIIENIGWPNGLSIDYANNRLYWVDAKLKIIESVRLDGSDRRTVLKDTAKQPFSLAVFENKLYWSDWSSNTIQSCDKLTGKDWQILVRENSTVYGLHIYHSVLKPKIANPCNARPCSQLCLLNRNNGYTCACTLDKELSADQHTCHALKKKEHLVIAAGNTFIDYYHELLGKPEMAASITLKHVTAHTYDSLTGTVLAHDQLTDHIFRFDTNTGDLSNIISLKGVIVGGMGFDYIGNNLYLSNIERNTIEVHSLSSNQKTVLYFQDQPQDIILVPEEGIMFTVFYADGKYKIYKMKMSGIGPRIEIAGDNLLGPKVSLCYDKQLKRVFWSDQGSGRIESTTVEGSNKYLFRTGLSEPVSLAILGDYVFWTQYKSNHLYWTDKNNTHLIQKHITLHVPKELDTLRLITLHGTYVHESHECRKNNGNCSHVCLVSNVHSFVCGCPPNMMLDADNRTCVPQTACEEGETKCGEHDMCIKLHQRCDGVRDCPNGEDESSYCAEFNSCGDNQFRCKSGECISSKQRCDSHYDCTDRSDEDDCDKKDCQTNEFQCREGNCISKYQVCDGQPDCPDLSDESDCGTHTCNPDSFMCNTRTCIPKSWVCDGQDDCKDGSDEGEKCQSNKCPTEMFSCHNTRCVDASLKCNGIDDCGDNSDEEYCLEGENIGSVNCTSEEYRCRGTEICLHKKNRCNGVQDCPKNDDEHGCARCLQEEFACENQRCIAQSWVCDMVNDCGDKSDERDCTGDNSRKISVSRSSNCEGFQCSTGACLPFSKVCNKIPDCPDGDDEFGKCAISCTKDNPCQGVCHKTPAGPVCGCQSGFRLSTDARTCEDIDECNENVCSQVCRNTIGSFSCSCYDGYILRSDRTSCKIAGKQMELITVARTGIRKLSASLSSIEVIHEELNFDITGIDVNAKDETIYWSNDELGAISKISLKNKMRQTVTGVGRPEALAVDWVTDNVYFNDNDHPSNIKVCHLEEKRCTKIFTVKGRSKAMSIAVDPTNGWLFWSQTNWLLYSNPMSEIYRSDMTGSNVTAIAYFSLGVVNGLAIDHMRSRLYWADTHKKTIEASDFDGFNRTTFLKTNNHQPASINIYEDSLYWLMGATGQLQKCKLHGDKSCETITVGTSNVERHFSILHTSRQPPVKNTCQNHECDYMCIMKKDDFACVCENGRPAESKAKCVQNTNVNLKFVSSTGHQNIGGTRQQSTIVTGIIVTIITSILILSAYCYYQKIKSDFSKTNGLSIRFQNPSYDQRSEITTPLNCISGLPPGEHEYINPVINISKKQEKEEQDKVGIIRSTHSDGDSDFEYKQNTQLIQ